VKPEKIKALLPLVGSSYLGSRAGWVLATCPLPWNHDGHAADAFGVSHSSKKKSRYKCMSCGSGGDLLDLIFALKAGSKKYPEYASKYKFALAANLINAEFEEMAIAIEDIPDYETPVIKEETVFPESWLASFKPATAFKDAMAYMHSRGIPATVTEALDVRYDPIQQRVCFPVRDFKGRLMGLQGRTISGASSTLAYSQYGYKNKRNMNIWMGEHSLDLDRPVVLCEGPFDYAKIYQVYPNVAASFTSGLSKAKTVRMGDADTIITFYDYGKGGDAARGYIKKHLPGYHIINLIPSKDEDDPGSMEPLAIMQYLEEHVPLT